MKGSVFPRVCGALGVLYLGLIGEAVATQGGEHWTAAESAPRIDALMQEPLSELLLRARDADDLGQLERAYIYYAIALQMDQADATAEWLTMAATTPVPARLRVVETLSSGGLGYRYRVEMVDGLPEAICRLNTRRCREFALNRSNPFAQDQKYAG
jgi:hypothetical protein